MAFITAIPSRLRAGDSPDPSCQCNAGGARPHQQGARTGTAAPYSATASRSRRPSPRPPFGPTFSVMSSPVT